MPSSSEYTQKEMQEAIKNTKIEVKKADGEKCPRCWNYHTVIGNPQNVCDRCLVIVTQMLNDLVRDGKVTQQDADEWLTETRTMVKRWLAEV